MHTNKPAVIWFSEGFKAMPCVEPTCWYILLIHKQTQLSESAFARFLDCVAEDEIGVPLSFTPARLALIP